jgi:Flp pilus assembly protein TadG
MRHRIQRRRPGTAALEFAIVLPLLFTMLFGIIQFGRIIMVQQVLTNACREGARMAVLDGSNAAGVTTAVQNCLANGSVSGATVLLSPSDPSTAVYGQPVTVTVRIPVNRAVWIANPAFVPGTTQLSASATMRRETVQ